MANNSPTLVMASLSDDQLKKSIDSLVTHVDEAMKKMVQSTNNAVGEMEAKLKSLGNLKIDSGGSADGGASKRAKAQNTETNAVEKTIAARDKQIKKNQEVKMSYDQMQTALEKATRLPSEMRMPDMTKSARESYLAFVQGFKAQGEAIARQIKDAEAALNKAVENRVNELNTKLANAKAKLNELNAELAKQRMNAERTGNYSTYNADITRTTQAIEYQMKHIAELQKKISEVSPNMFTQQVQGISALRREYERVANIMKEDVTTRLQSTNTTQQQLTQSAKEYSEQVKKIAAEIRESAQWQKTDKFGFRRGMMNFDGRAYPVTENLDMGLRLEDQIVSILQRANDERQKGVQITQQQAQSSRQVSEEDRKAAEALGWTNSQQKRKYTPPMMNIERISEARGALQSITGMQEAWVDSINKTKSSYYQLSDYVKQLKNELTHLPKGVNDDAAKVLIREIQQAEREMQKFQKTMSRPVSLKDAMGSSEETLDDIAYKMQRLSSYRSGLNVDTQKKEIQQVNDEYNRLKKRMDEVMQKNQQMIASNTALGRSWNYMKNRLAFYFTVGASTQFVKNLIEVRSQYEMNERALGILINSAERGTQIFNELSQMALVSPYTLIELSAAAKQLTAYDIAAKDVVNTTRRLADMAAAVGIPIERLTYALGQVKAYGYLNARDARMFANAGIPLVKNLSEYYTELEGRLVSTADIYDRIKKKQIGYEEVMSTISKMTDEGGKFYDFQAKMAETLKVQLANLTLAWNNMLNAMGEESQGVLVGGINALKQMFLHWKDIEHVLYELVVALGAYKAYQIITTRLVGATAASLDAQVLAIKRNNAAMLEKQALTRKLTIDELRQVAAQKQVTAADYQNALSGKQLTKQKALLLVALNKNNVQLKAALVNMGLLTTAEAASITRGKALAIVFKSIGISIKNAALAIKAFAASMWPLLVVGALYELWHAWDSYGEHIEEVNKQAAEHAKEAFENIKQYLESDVTSALQDRLAKGGKVESDAAGQKAWDEMREKIELSSSASNAFIAKLMQINDINERLSAGFGYLEDIQRVAGVMQTLEKDAVDVSSTTLGGLFGEGLKDDLEDFINAYQKYVSLNENLRQSGVGEEYFNDQKRALEEFRGEVEKTTTSLYNIASKEGFNTNEQREFFEREISEIAQAEQMGAKETRIFRMQAEKEYYAYARAQLVSQLEYQNGAQKALTQKRINDLDNEFGKNKAMQESFFTWLTEKQDHAVKNMLRGKTQEEIKQGEWLKGSNAKWVEEMARKFSKEYGVSFDDLHKLVMDANTWHINIPVFFQTIGQPLSDIQRDYEARTGKKFSSNPLIKDAKSQVEIIDILKKKQKEVANEMATAEKAGGKYWEDNKQRYKEENDALVADIHAYNALTDAEEKANKKNNKDSKKDPMLDTLKETINIVKKLQSEYDTLTKSGASSADALDDVRKRYSRTINLLNKDLKGFGLPEIDVNMIKGRNPNDVLEYFQKISDILTNKGLSTLERQKAVEVVIQEFSLKAKTYNLDMITKGLNNELGKLKDEYELAVELDANPELGNIFADMFDINVQDLPHSIEEYASRVVDELNKAIKGRGDNVVLPTLFLTKDDIEAYREMSKEGKLNKESLKDIEDSDKKIRDLREKAAVDVSKIVNEYIKEYGDLAAQIALIEQEKDTNLTKLNAVYYTEELRQTQRYVDAKFAIEEAARRKEAKATFEALKKETDYERFFTAIDTLTRTDALSIKNKIKQGIINAFKNGGLTVSQFRKEIKALEEQFDKLSQTTSNWVSYLNGGFDKLIQRTKQTGQELETIGERMAIQGKVDDIDRNYLNSLGKIFSNGTGGKMNFSSLMGQFSGNIKGLGGAVSQAGQGMQAGASKFMQAIAIIDTVIKNIHQTVQAIDSVFQELNSTRNEENKIGGALWEGFKKFDNYAYSGWENLKSGNIAGAVADTANSIISIANTFEEIKNKRINDEIKESERSVKQLELAYIDLEHAADEAYGTSIIGAKQAAAENKRLQLAELRRQLQLEEARSKKRRDEDKIIDLRKQIKELEYDIKNTTKEITNDLLGISSVGDAAENLIKNIIDAFRDGKYKLKDIMKDIKASFNDMIAEMLVKLLTTKLVEPWFEEQWKKIESEIANRNKSQTDQLNNLIKHKSFIESYGDAGDTAEWIYDNDRAKFQELYRSVLAPVFGDVVAPGDLNEESRKAMFDWLWSSGYAQKIVDAYVGGLDSSISQLSKDASKVTLEDIKRFGDYLNSSENPLEDENVIKFIEDLARKFGLIGDKKQSTLSALQQGLQSVSEETASAVEAYLNGMSQQAYLRNDLLTQIRDTIMSFDMDMQLGVFSQMLLQLQNNYIVMQSMQSMMENWTVPSGNGIRVELLS